LLQRNQIADIDNVVHDDSFVAVVPAWFKWDAAPLPFSAENKPVFSDLIFTDDGAGCHGNAEI
jgi:hypothetical protein